MIHAYKFPTATALHTSLTKRLAYSPMDKLDMASTVDTHLCNVVARADSFQWEFNLKDLWLTSSRWTMLARQYINPWALDAWLDQIQDRMSSPGKKSRGMALMRTQTVQARQHGTKTARRWGSCIIAVSFRRQPEPQITLYSRTSYMGYLAPLDITVAHTCAQLISKRIGVAVEDMSFVWMLEDAQFSFKSMAFLFMNPTYYHDLETYDLSDKSGIQKHPGLHLSAKWWNTFRQEDEDGRLYGDMTWGGCRRIRKRWHTEVLGYPYGERFEGGARAKSQGKRYKPLPDLMSTKLSFDVLDKVRDRTNPEESATMVEGETEED